MIQAGVIDGGDGKVPNVSPRNLWTYSFVLMIKNTLDLCCTLTIPMQGLLIKCELSLMMRTLY